MNETANPTRPVEDEVERRQEPEDSSGDKNLLEAIRLIDEQKLSIEEASAMMGLGTSTFRRLLENARIKFSR